MNSNQKQTHCVDGWHYCNTNNITQYEKINAKTDNSFTVRKRHCDIFGRNKSQTFSK